ncbi:MAG: radical SAM protein [Parcubacteria group bacterium]|nr:radical SAM protein [Parcubacteria group bacterium]
MKTNKSPKENQIKDVVLAITYQCNAHCQFCHIWKNKERFSLQAGDYKNLPRNTENINISGGEPFLRNDLPAIIRTINHQCSRAKIIISTNGFLPSTIKRQMQEIIKFKKDIGIAVSLDGFGKVHEDLRGFPGGFSLVLESIRLLRDLGIKNLKIAFTLNNKNINQLKRVYQLSKELGVEFSLAVCHDSSHYFKKQNNEITNTIQIKRQISWLIEEELKSFSPKKWLRAYFAWGMLGFLKNRKRVLPDYSGLNSLFIDPFGNIYPSDVWDMKIGRLQEIKNWNSFVLKTKEILLSKDKERPNSWMICTARQAMKKHWLKVSLWILQTKFCSNKKVYGFTFVQNRAAIQ